MKYQTEIFFITGIFTFSSQLNSPPRPRSSWQGRPGRGSRGSCWDPPPSSCWPAPLCEGAGSPWEWWRPVSAWSCSWWLPWAGQRRSRRRSRRLSCGPSLSMTRNPSLLSPDECPEILLVVISRHHLLEVLQLGGVHRPVPLQLVLALVWHKHQLQDSCSLWLSSPIMVLRSLLSSIQQTNDFWYPEGPCSRA